MNENFAQQIIESGFRNAFKLATRLGWQVLKRVLYKFVLWLLSVLAPFWVPLLISISVACFIYYAVFMIPKFISSSSIGNCNYDVRVSSNIDAATLNKTLGGALAGHGQDFIQAGQEYGIDQAFLAAVSMTETGNGQVATGNNVAGMMGNGGLMQFGSIRDGILAEAANIKNLYIDQGLDTIGQIQQKYAPVGATNDPNNLNSNWTKEVIAFMGELGVSAAYNGDSGGSGGSGTDHAIFTYGNNDVWSPKRDQELYDQYLGKDVGFINQFQSHDQLANEVIQKISGNAANPNATVKDVWGQYMTDVPTVGAGIVAEQDMVKPHAVPWALLGAVDRVTGDPIITGRHGIEEKNDTSFWSEIFGGKKTNGRDPDISADFDALKPTISDQTFTLYYYRHWDECDKDGGCTSYTEEYQQNIKLLVKADDYAAHFTYTWQPKVYERHEAHLDEKIIVPEFVSCSESGPYYEKVINILSNNGITGNFNLEFTLQLAMNMDDTFKIEGNLFSTMTNLDIKDVTYDGPLGKFYAPVVAPVTSPFGYRVDPVTGRYALHTGIDLGAPMGTPVKAAQNGVVIFAGVNGGYGNCIIVDHGTFQTLYGHLSKIGVTVGQQVQGGEVIGNVGATGDATGPHLHFEVRLKQNGQIVFDDPAKYLH